MTITYDDAGNPLSYYNGSAYTLTWQNGRELATATKNGVTSSYKYNIDGQRVQKTVGDVVYDYYYADGLLVRQTWGNNYIDFLYDESGSPYSLIYDGVQYYYVKNVQGDVVQIRSVYGTLLVEYTYDAWGNVLSITGSNASVLGANNPIRYRSYYYDFETGFYYLQSRYYDPAIRRFINADGYVNANGGFIGYNMYAYCSNSPIVYKDSNGNFIDTIFDVISLGFSVAEVIANPADPLAWIGLVGDAVDLIPFVSGVGEAVRVVKIADNIIDAADTVHDVSKAVDNVEDVLDAAGDVARKTDFYVTPNGEAIPATLDGFNDNLSKLNYQNGKYIGTDSNGPIRIRTNEIHLSDPNFTGVPNPLHTVPHFHIDRRANGFTGKWGKTFTGPMEMFY